MRRRVTQNPIQIWMRYSPCGLTWTQSLPQLPPSSFIRAFPFHSSKVFFSHPRPFSKPFFFLPLFFQRFLPSSCGNYFTYYAIAFVFQDCYLSDHVMPTEKTSPASFFPSSLLPFLFLFFLVRVFRFACFLSTSVLTIQL